jgi:hypothetical protein
MAMLRSSRTVSDPAALRSAAASKVGQLGVELSFPGSLKRPQNIASCGRRAQKFMAMKSYPNPGKWS